MEENLGEIRLHPEWKNLYEQAKEWEYGSFHPHDKLESIMSLKIGNRYYRQVQKANDALQNNWKKCLRTVQGKGYEVAPPNKHLSISADIMEAAKRKVRKGARVATCTNTEMLTIEENQQLADYLSRLGRFRSLSEETTRELRQIADGRKVNRDVPRIGS